MYKKAVCRRGILRQTFFVRKILTNLFHAVFIRFNHLFNHLTADRACLLRGQIAVVPLFQVNTYFGSCFHLELIKCRASFGDYILSASHSKHSFAINFAFAIVFWAIWILLSQKINAKDVKFLQLIAKFFLAYSANLLHIYY